MNNVEDEKKLDAKLLNTATYAYQLAGLILIKLVKNEQPKEKKR